MRCPTCNNEIPPEYPPEEYPFCMFCSCPLGPVRQPPMPPNDRDPYRDPARDGYRDPYQAPPRDPYQAPRDPYRDQYQEPARDPYRDPGQGASYREPGPHDPYRDAGPGGREPYRDARPPDPYRDPRPPDPYRDPQYDPYRDPAAAPPRPAQPARLILESGLGKVEYPLDAGVVTIGRSKTNDIPIEDARASRQHARIYQDERGYLIEDLNSRNGTRVDDRPIRDSSQLQDGSIVKIGDTVFRFQAAQGPAAAPPDPRGGWTPERPPASRPAQPPAESVPVVFLPPWGPVECPNCRGLKTMRPVVYGEAARTPDAQAAARRGEIALGTGAAHPDAANAECRACGTRVRIVQAGS